MPPIEIEKLELACIRLAEAIEDGEWVGLAREIKNLLGYQ